MGNVLAILKRRNILGKGLESDMSFGEVMHHGDMWMVETKNKAANTVYNLLTYFRFSKIILDGTTLLDLEGQTPDALRLTEVNKSDITKWTTLTLGSKLVISRTPGPTYKLTVSDGYLCINGISTGVTATDTNHTITISDDDKWVVDGVTTSVTVAAPTNANSGEETYTIKLIEAGVHILYFKGKYISTSAQLYPNQSRFTVIRTPTEINDSITPTKLLRYGRDTGSDALYPCRLDCLLQSPPTTNALTKSGVKGFSKIRVPIGKKQAYIEASTNYAAFQNYIEEFNFTIIPDND